MEIFSVLSTCNCQPRNSIASRLSCPSFETVKPHTQQRLIPLTEEIRKAMEDFNNSPSTTSLSNGRPLKSLSLTSLVGSFKDMHNIVLELSMSQAFQRMEEFVRLIRKCLENKTSQTEPKGKADNANEPTANKDEELVEDPEIVYERLANLEKRLKHMEATTDDDLSCASNQLIKPDVKSTESVHKGIVVWDYPNLKLKKRDSPFGRELKKLDSQFLHREKPIFEEVYSKTVYYRMREHYLNQTLYKKSEATLALNRQACFNPFVKPILSTLPPAPKRRKHVPTFVENGFY